MRQILLTLTFVLLAQSALAQASVGLYGGVAEHNVATGMVMADFTTKGGVTSEPWLQNYGKVVQAGFDFIVVQRVVGYTVGINSNTFGVRGGIVLSYKRFQARVMAHSSGAVQGVLYYTQPMGDHYYVQGWAAPAGHGGSSYLVGLGRNF